MKNTKVNFLRQLQDKDFGEILKGGSIHFIAKIFSVLLGVLFSLIVTRYYGASAMGVYAIISSFLGITLIFSMMGMNTAILRFIPEHIAKYSHKSAYQLFYQLFKLVFLFSGIVGILSLVFSNYLSKGIFNQEYLYPLFVLAALFIIVQALGKLALESIRALKNIKTYAYIDLATNVFKIIVLTILTYFVYSQHNAVYTLFASIIFVFIVSFYAINKLFKRDMDVSEKTKSFSHRYIMRTAFPMFLTGMMSMVISQTDILMLGMMNSMEEVGIYSIASKLALLTSFVLTSINSIATPKFAELYHLGQIDTLTKIAQKSSKLIFLGSLPIIVCFVLLGKYILLIFGEEFVAGYSALLILVFGQFVNGMAGSVGSFLNMTGHQLVFNRIVIIGGVTNIILNYLLIPIYGIEGAAFASMLSIVLWNVLASFYIKYKFGFYIGYIPIRLKKDKK